MKTVALVLQPRKDDPNVGTRRPSMLFPLLVLVFIPALPATGSRASSRYHARPWTSRRAGGSRSTRTISASRSAGSIPGSTARRGATAEVPRAWDTFDESLRGFEGIGWYAVTLDGSWARPGKLQRLTFGRVMYHAKVWLNGEFLGEHIDGYLPFAFDVTGKLKGSENHLVLRVDNRPRIDWLPAAKQIEWVQYGGILQPVRLESTGQDLDLGPGHPGGAAGRGRLDRVHCRARGSRGRRRHRASRRSSRRSSGRARRSRPHRWQVSRHELALTLRARRALVARVAAPVHPGRDPGAGRTVIDRVTTPFGVRTIAARGRQLL